MKKLFILSLSLFLFSGLYAQKDLGLYPLGMFSIGGEEYVFFSDRISSDLNVPTSFEELEAVPENRLLVALQPHLTFQYHLNRILKNALDEIEDSSEGDSALLSNTISVVLQQQNEILSVKDALQNTSYYSPNEYKIYQEMVSNLEKRGVVNREDARFFNKLINSVLSSLQNGKVVEKTQELQSQLKNSRD